MDDVVSFLETSTLLLKSKKKSIDEIYREMKVFVTSFFSLLPLDLKIEICKKVLCYDQRKEYENCKNLCKNYKIVLVLLGRDFSYVVKNLFKEDPIATIKRYEEFNIKVKEIIKGLRIENFTIYRWNESVRELICFVENTEKLSKHTFEPCEMVTLHETESCVSRMRHRNISSYEEFYTEGIYLGHFIPIHYVNKKPLVEIFC